MHSNTSSKCNHHHQHHRVSGEDDSPLSVTRSATTATTGTSRVSHEMLRAEAMRALSSALDAVGSERTEISTQSAATRLSTRLSSGNGDDEHLEHLEDPVQVEDPGELDDPCAHCTTITLPLRCGTTSSDGLPPTGVLAGLTPQVRGGIEPPKRYKPVRLIGQGAYGSAWLCFDTLHDNRPVVVKSMSVPSMTPKAWELTQNEIKCLADTNHPNIIRFYDALMEDNRQHIVMEYADAGDLGQIIAQRAASNARLSEREALFLFVQLSMALQHVHSKAILHRDVKSANVLMMTNGLVKLGDFGFSRQYNVGDADGDGSATTASCSAQTFCGTPYYLAPELWTNSRYGKKADVWSLGIILYELLTFRRPFSGANVQALAANIVSGLYEPLSAADCSPPVQKLVALLLDVDPNRRPTMLSLFNHPVPREHLVLLRTAIDNNARICDPVKRQWHTAAVDVLTASTELLGGAVAPDLPIPAASGFVRRYVAGATPTWTLHQLTLEGGHTLVLAPPPSRTASDGLPPAAQPSSRKEIPVAQLRTVVSVPQEASFGIPGVFAVTTKEGRCTWFQAQSEQEREQWIRVLRLAIVHALG